MLFSSIDFAFFLPVVFFLYWYVFNKNIRVQNFLIVAASYVFYGWWDWRFLTLIFFSTLVDYQVGVRISKAQSKNWRKVLFAISVLTNIGLLGFFKYYNFFIDSFNQGFKVFGFDLSLGTLSIVLPVGISFYTFQTLSYTIDVYRRKVEATNDFVAFAAFVSFFPQLVAGPIERASNLLPQFKKSRQFVYENAADGMRQILWGLFKKIVIADNCGEIANNIFDNSSNLNGSTLILGAVIFSFQMYGDFSGYSDIAIGTARLFGFNLSQNFAFPYFSRDVGEFWRRWHISLSTWFRDYVYIPLGGSKGSTLTKVRNTFVIFILSGLWHGANWTFIIWAVINAIYFLPLLLDGTHRNHLLPVAQNRAFPNGIELRQMLVTFALTTFARIFFRAESVGHAFSYIFGILSASVFEMPRHFGGIKLIPLILLLIFFLVVEWRGRENDHALVVDRGGYSRWSRWLFYCFVVMLIIWYPGRPQDFIYFQF